MHRTPSAIGNAQTRLKLASAEALAGGAQAMGGTRVLDDSAMLSFVHPGRKPAGRIAECQDRIVTRQLEATTDLSAGMLIGVADGISQCPFGGSVARYVAETHLGHDEVRVPQQRLSVSLPVCLHTLYARFQAEFAESTDMLDSGTTVSVAGWERDEITVCWVGDSPVFHLSLEEKAWRGEQISRPDMDRQRNQLTDCFGRYAPGRFKVRCLPARAGDIIVVSTDGAELDGLLLADLMAKHGFTRRWIENAVEPVLRRRYYDDISVVAMKILGEDR